MTAQQMGRRFNFPNPGNVTVANPTYLASKDLVLNLYNQENPESKAANYCQRAKEWFIAEALSIGWSNALEPGNNLGILLHLQLNLPHLVQQGQLPPEI